MESSLNQDAVIQIKILQKCHVSALQNWSVNEENNGHITFIVKAKVPGSDLRTKMSDNLQNFYKRMNGIHFFKNAQHLISFPKWFHKKHGFLLK